MRTVYSTNNAMQMRANGTPVDNPCNQFDCGIAIGASEDEFGFYSLNVANNTDPENPGAWAKLDRAELIAIRDAINEELARVN